MKINFNKEDVTKVGKTALLSLLVLAGTVASAVLKKEAEGSVVTPDADYGAAINAVMNSDMMSSHMRDAVEAIPKDATSSLYSGIISIAKGSAMSAIKRDTIVSISQK